MVSVLEFGSRGHCSIPGMSTKFKMFPLIAFVQPLIKNATGIDTTKLKTFFIQVNKLLKIKLSYYAYLL